jgi:hypothetical protein
VHGIPVVGNGSKVILTFTNDGSLESFRYDWLTYRVVSSQSLVGAGEILSRVQKVVSTRAGVAAPVTGAVAPSSVTAPYPVELTPNTKLKALDCGYYDAGSCARQTQSVQTGMHLSGGFPRRGWIARGVFRRRSRRRTVRIGRCLA